MKKTKIIIVELVIIFAFVFTSISLAQDYSTTPKLKNKGRKYRIAYLQGGSYFEYDKVFLAVINQLKAMGWSKNILFPADEAKTAKDLFGYLSTHKRWSKHIEFPENAFYDNNWKDKNRKHTMTAIYIRKDIDMIFALGTWAGQDMKNMPADYKVPVVVMDVSDALGSKIVDSNEYSGRANLTARVDPLRYQRQIKLFHDIIGFKNLGMAFEDTIEGHSYAAINDVETIARQRNFNVIKALHTGYYKSKKEAVKWLVNAVRGLSTKIDAFYLTQQLALDSDSLPAILKILNSNKIPTFSQTGSIEVKNGALLSIATSGFKYVAEYHAKKIAMILNGANPQSLSLLFEDPAKIAINLKTAQRIGFDPPVDILGAADEIFTE